MKITILAIILSLSSLTAWGHALWEYPFPRNERDNIKRGPCGVERTDQPMEVIPGQVLSVQWKETIDHPGRYYINLLPENDSQDLAIELANVPDELETPVPHSYQEPVQLPADLAPGLYTLQLIQSMEENPQNPTFYFSCADIYVADKEGAQAELPSRDPQSLTANQPSLGGCGSTHNGNGPPSSSGSATAFLLLILPFSFLACLRRFMQV